MTDSQTLYQAILADPDDDTLRLIYADAVEEEGESEYASFIRDQVKLSLVPEYEPAAIQLRQREREAEELPTIRERLPELPEGLGWMRQPFRRGCPAGIAARDAAVFVSHADELFAMAPIESLELSVARLPEVQAFANCPWRNRLKRLAILSGLGGRAASGLLGTTYERLKELHVGAGLSTASTASSLVRCQTFRQLDILRCPDNRAGGQTLINELIHLAHHPRLKTLDLSDNRLTGEAVSRLLSAPAVATLENLDLSHNDLGPEGTAAIARTDLPQLRSLRLTGCRLDESAIDTLTQKQGMRLLFQLRSLNLNGNYLPSSSATILARLGLTHLRALYLRENRLGDTGARAIATSSYFEELALLDLSDNQMSDAGGLALCHSPILRDIEQILLEGNTFSEAVQSQLRERFKDRIVL